MYGVRTAEAMMATPHINQIRMAEFFAEIISEHAGILCASAILSFGRVSGASLALAGRCMWLNEDDPGIRTSLP